MSYLRFCVVMTSSRRVLIIDDNVALAENIAEILEMDGHATEVALSAEEALPKAQRSEPDVVVADYRLPGLTGAAFIKQFKLGRLNVVGVIISAYTDDGTMREAREAGASFMAKPLDFSLLSRMVREGTA
jgi:two-component system NtrC family sensor kinase